MAKKQSKQNQKLLIVSIRYIAAPDARERLSRAINILLGSAARGTVKSEGNINAKKEGPPYRAPAEDTLTGVDEEGNVRE